MLKQFIKWLLSRKEDYASEDEDFVWALAEALLWRDEGVSCGAIPAPIRQQPDAKKYYDDAEYLITATLSKYSSTKKESPNER